MAPDKKIGIDTEALAGMELSQLQGLHDAFRTLWEVAGALSAQPRFEDQEDRENVAGRLLFELNDWLGGYMEETVKAIRKRLVASDGQFDDGAWAVLRYEAQMAESLSDFAVLAAQLSRDAKGKAA